MKTSGYNIMRDDSALLEEHEKSPPSFAVYLYPDHWTLNSGPKFSYNNHVSSILEDIRAFRIPTDFIQIFDDAGVPYYSGCLIVEILDFRPARAKEPILDRPDKQRVVLRPNAETVWADICTMNANTGAKWSDAEALKVEAKILLSTSTPLCLDPDPSLTRIVNSILRVSTPNVPNSLKRKAAAMVDLEEDETEKAKRAKIMQFMNPQFNTARKPFLPNYKILTLMEQRRAAVAAAKQNPQPSSSAMVPPNLPPNIAIPPGLVVAQASDKAPSTITPILTTSYSQSSTISQPAPVTKPPSQIPSQLQQAVDPSQRLSPLKQQQASNDPVSQRPPSQPVAAPQTNGTNQQPQAHGQQASPFNPPIPPSNFLNPPPSSRRRPSAAVKPSTPAASNLLLPVQQPASQAQPQAQTQTQTQLQPQQRPPSQPQAQLQHAQAQMQQVRPTQVPTSMQSIQNMAQFYQNGRTLPMSQAAATVSAQRQALSGRNTPVNGTNPSASPAPPPSAIARSPMLPAAAVAAMMSRQNTPVATSNQVARGSPLAGNHPVAARAVAAQNMPQQQMPGGQTVLMQPGSAANSALAYQHYQIQQQQRIQAYIRAQAQQQAQQQAQLHQQGHVSPAPQQQQQNSQPGNAQSQQTSQEQPAGAQQPFTGVQVPPQAYNYMQMNMNLQHPQQYLWPQRVVGRAMAQVPSNGQQQIPAMPPGMTMQQMQGLGRAGGLPNR